MKNTIVRGIAAGALTLFVAAGGIAYADNGNGKGNSGKGVTKAIENAISRLEKFEVKSFSDDDFNSGSLPSTLTINPGGQVRLTNATVTGAGSGSITVRIWGFSFTINTTSDTKVFLWKNTSGTLADVKVGDSVSVVGTTSEASPGVIAASVIHDRTASGGGSNEEVSRLRAQVEALIRRLNELLARVGGGTTTPPADVTAPVVSGVTASTTATNTALIAWTTNEAATSKVYYSSTSPVVATSSTPSVSNASLVTGHNLTITGLTASTTYYFLVQSADAAGNTGTANTSQFNP